MFKNSKDWATVDREIPLAAKHLKLFIGHGVCSKISPFGRSYYKDVIVKRGIPDQVMLKVKI